MTWPLVTLILGLTFGAALLTLAWALLYGIATEARKTKVKEAQLADDRRSRLSERPRRQMLVTTVPSNGVFAWRHGTLVQCPVPAERPARTDHAAERTPRTARASSQQDGTRRTAESAGAHVTAAAHLTRSLMRGF